MNWNILRLQPTLLLDYDLREDGLRDLGLFVMIFILKDGLLVPP